MKRQTDSYGKVMKKYKVQCKEKNKTKNIYI